MAQNGIIRAAGIQDLDAVNLLLGQVLKLHHEGRPDLFHASGKKYTDGELLSIFSNLDTPVFVYEQDGVVLGYVFCVLSHVSSGSMKPLDTLYIDDLCVAEQARGQHIGKALFEYAVAYARSHGCYNVTLHVWECNPSARAFYESLGMKPQYASMELFCQEPTGKDRRRP